MASNGEKSESKHEHNFIEDDKGIVGLNQQHVVFQPEQKEHNDIEAKEKPNLTNSVPVGHPENVLLNEKCGSSKDGDSTRANNSARGGKEN